MPGAVPSLSFNADFLKDPDDLFRVLQRHVVWDERMAARRTASFGASYNYSQISYPPTPMLPVLLPLCDAIQQELGFVANNCLLNEYPNGRSSMGFHTDDLRILHENTGVAIVSLGATRSIVFRHKQTRQQIALPLPAGSLLFLPNQAQEEWLHAIPRTPEAGVRISLSFRKIREDSASPF